MGFAEIASGEQSVYKIAEDDLFLAFLEPEPIALGHCIVIPKLSQGYIFDMEDALLSEFHLFAKGVAISIKKAIKCKKVGIAVIGIVEPHTHIHLLPLNASTQMNFSTPRLQVSQEEMEAVYASILKYSQLRLDF